MAKRKHRRRSKPAGAISLPLMLTETLLSSVQTITQRSLLIAQGRCSAAEYQKMVLEKAAATQDSATVFTRKGGAASASRLLAPWHRRVKANARRLSKSKA